MESTVFAYTPSSNNLPTSWDICYDQWTYTDALSSSSTVYIRFPLGVVYSLGCDKHTMTCIRHCSITQNPKKKKKILSALSIHPSLPPFRATTDPSYCLHSFTFPRRSCSWNHTVQSLFRLASFTNAHWRFLHVFSWLVSSLFFALNNTALSECITHLLKDILVASKFWQIWVKLL